MSAPETNPGEPSLRTLLAKLGPRKNGKSCLYVKRHSDSDEAALTQMGSRNVNAMASKRTA